MISRPAGPIAMTFRPIYLRYVAVSVAALGIDFAFFLVALTAGTLAPAAAAAIGYATGIAVHWWLSSRTVFGTRLAESGAGRRRQQALFLASAGAGLALTSVIVALGGWAGLDPRLAKLVAIVVSFQATYLLRRRIVFA